MNWYLTIFYCVRVALDADIGLVNSYDYAEDADAALTAALRGEGVSGYLKRGFIISFHATEKVPDNVTNSINNQ